MFSRSGSSVPNVLLLLCGDDDRGRWGGEAIATVACGIARWHPHSMLIEL